MPLMSLLKSEGITRLDLLQIDTEGFDAEIIKMIDFSVIRPQIIKYEHVGLSDADKQNTELLLKQYGYRVFREGGDSIAVKK